MGRKKAYDPVKALMVRGVHDLNQARVLLLMASHYLVRGEEQTVVPLEREFFFS